MSAMQDIKLESRKSPKGDWGTRRHYVAENEGARYGERAQACRKALIERAVEEMYRWMQHDTVSQFRIIGLSKEEELIAFPVRRRRSK